MTDLDKYLHEIEHDRLPVLRAQLAPLVDGKMWMGERRIRGGKWVDTTQKHIEHLRRAIADYETMITLKGAA